MPWVIDGNNVLAQMPGLSRNDPAHRRHLSSLVTRFCEARRCRATLFFDGAPLRGWRPSTSLGALSVRHSGAGRSADDAILELVSGFRRPRDLKVVTSDRSLAGRCRHLGASTVPVGEFRSMLASARSAAGTSAEKPERVDPAEVDYYMKAFGAGGEGDEGPSKRRR